MTLVTEKEAVEKWCPMARVATPVTAHLTGHVIAAIACNRSSRSAPDQRLKAEVSPESARCIGSRCMAWRWAIEEGRARGYCGAFGKVEP